MQGAGSTSSRLVSEPEPTRAGLSPTVAFLLLVALIVLVGLVIFLLRPDPVPPPDATNTNTEPSFTLTNAEAIARLQELEMLRQQAFEEVDPALLPLIYRSGSKVMSIATRDLRKLQSDAVRDESTFTTRSVQVVANESERVVLRAVVDVEPRFLRGGKEVTTGPELVRRTIRWTLVRRGETWLIGDSLITRARVLRD